MLLACNARCLFHQQRSKALQVPRHCHSCHLHVQLTVQCLCSSRATSHITHRHTQTHTDTHTDTHRHTQTHTDTHTFGLPCCRVTWCWNLLGLRALTGTTLPYTCSSRTIDTLPCKAEHNIHTHADKTTERNGNATSCMSVVGRVTSGSSVHPARRSHLELWSEGQLRALAETKKANQNVLIRVLISCSTRIVCVCVCVRVRVRACVHVRARPCEL